MEVDVAELAARAVRAFNARDLEAWREMCAPDVELRSLFAGAGAVYSGRDGLARWYKDLADVWESMVLEMTDVIEVDEQTAITLHIARGRARTSQVELEEEIAHVITHREGLVRRLVVYGDPDEALKAVGAGPRRLRDPSEDQGAS